MQRAGAKLAAAGRNKGSPSGRHDHRMTAFAAIGDDDLAGAPQQAEQLIAGHSARIYTLLLINRSVLCRDPANGRDTDDLARSQRATAGYQPP
jgi:hypothetical protein